MSLYNLLFGVNPAAPVLLAMLGIDANDVPRFRDCFVSEGRIAVHTRTGGGNRDYYESLESCKANYPGYFAEKVEDKPSGPWNEDLRKLPGFISDEDSEYDPTYATFYFEVPAQFKHLLEKLPEGEDPAKRWRDTIEKLKKDPADPKVAAKLVSVIQPILDKLASPTKE